MEQGTSYGDKYLILYEFKVFFMPLQTTFHTTYLLRRLTPQTEEELLRCLRGAMGHPQFGTVEPLRRWFTGLSAKGLRVENSARVQGIWSKTCTGD